MLYECNLSAKKTKKEFNGKKLGGGGKDLTQPCSRTGFLRSFQDWPKPAANSDSPAISSTWRRVKPRLSASPLFFLGWVSIRFLLSLGCLLFSCGPWRIYSTCATFFVLQLSSGNNNNKKNLQPLKPTVKHLEKIADLLKSKHSPEVGWWNFPEPR